MNYANTLNKSTEISYSSKDLLFLIVPIVTEQLLAVSVGLVDQIMVAHIGENAVSAVSLVDSINVLLTRAFLGFATGGAIIAGQHLGRREHEDASSIAKQMTAMLFSISSIICLLLYILKQPLLNSAFGDASEAIMQDTYRYYSITTISYPFVAFYTCCSALLLIMNRSDISFKISLISNVINIIGNYILIYVFELGIEGAAIPTLISRIASAGISFCILQRKDRAISLSGFNLQLNKKMCRRISRVAVPYSLENAMFHFGRFILISLISSFGTASIMANAVGGTLGVLQNTISISIGIGLTTVASQCIGNGDYKKVRGYTIRLLKIDYLIQLLINIAIVLMLPLIATLYRISGETLELTFTVLIIHGLAAVLLHPTAFPLADVLHSSGDVRFTTAISTMSMWLCRVALSYVFHFAFGLGVVGVYLAHAMDWVFRSIAFVIRYRGNRWEMHKI